MNRMAQPNQASIVGIVLAPVLAGSVAAATNLTNFVYSRPTYFIIWGAAHLLTFGFGLWVASLLGRRPTTVTCIGLGLLAGGVEAFVVFRLLDGLTLVVGYEILQMFVGPEDYIAAAATVAMFSAGAMRGLRTRAMVHAGGGAMSDNARPVPSATLTQFFSAAGPSIVVIAGLLKVMVE